MRAGIYTRISKADPRVAKVENQEAACRKLAERHGYDVARVYVDDGVSAFLDRDRPGWNALLEDVAAGRIDVLLAQAEDRFTRQTMEKETLTLASVQGGVYWHTVSEGRTDPSSADGHFFATMRGALGQMEAARKAERQRAANDALRAKGLPPHGPRPFGWEPDQVTLREDEAELVRCAADSVLSGASIYSVVKEWNEAGVRTARGSEWNITAVKQLLARPRNAGLLTQGPGGREVVKGPSQVAPILDREKWEAVRALVTNPAREYDRGTARAWYLSGTARCHCGAKLRVTSRNRYCCASWEKGSVDRSVKHVTIDAEALEELVTGEVVRALLYGPEQQVTGDRAAEVARLHVERETVREGLARLVEAVASGALSPADVAGKRAELAAEEERLETALREHLAADARTALVYEARAGVFGGGKASPLGAAEAKEQLRERFNALSVDRRRALARSLVEVTVGNGRGMGRVEVTHLVALSLNEAA